jgi:raffinose/stachyose/melibiose transport system permease protein
MQWRTRGVATFQSLYSQNTAAIFAFPTLSMVPALAFFVFAERRIIGGLTGAKGVGSGGK